MNSFETDKPESNKIQQDHWESAKLIQPGISPLFFNQKMQQKDPEKKMPSTHAKAIRRFVNDSWDLLRQCGALNAVRDPSNCPFCLFSNDRDCFDRAEETRLLVRVVGAVGLDQQ